MQPYHFRRVELMIDDEATCAEIIRSQKYMTLALCKDNQPYLVTMNYAYDPARRCFYFHCAAQGRKIEFWRANPAVWGQILEDRGYLVGRCDHAYRTVQFAGSVGFVTDLAEKQHALGLMIDFLEPEPAPVRERLLIEHRIANVNVGRVVVDTMTAKQDHVSKEH